MDLKALEVASPSGILARLFGEGCWLLPLRVFLAPCRMEDRMVDMQSKALSLVLATVSGPLPPVQDNP